MENQKPDDDGHDDKSDANLGLEQFSVEVLEFILGVLEAQERRDAKLRRSQKSQDPQ